MLEFEAVEAWFRRFTPLLDRFTSERNVMITKYLHNTPAWRFAFENPPGGQGAIDLWRIDERTCRINAVAWIDDEETDRRDLRTRASVEFEATEARIVEELNCALDELMSWDASDPSGWRSVDPPFHSTLRTGADRKRPRPVVQVLPTARPRKITVAPGGLGTTVRSLAELGRRRVTQNDPGAAVQGRCNSPPFIDV